MIFLNGNTESIKLSTSSVADIDCSVVYSDLPAITSVYQSKELKITTATSTTILNDVPVNTMRAVRSITIKNIHASVSNTVSISKQVNAISYSLTAYITLLAGEVYEYHDNIGWTYYAADGSIKSSNTGIAASGDLSGTYPSPTVIKLLGNTIPVNSVGFFYNDGVGNIVWQAAGTNAVAGLSIVPGGGSGINELDTAGGYTFGKLVAALKLAKIIT